METSIEKLSSFSEQLSIADIDNNTLHWAKLCVMDALECCLHTIGDDRLKAAHTVAAHKPGCCTLFGASGSSNAHSAALYNVVAGSIAGRNDMSFEGNAHPGAAIIPLALAVGEEENANGRRVLESIVLGYEVLIRFGKMLRCGDARILPALRPTSLGVSFATAVTASKLRAFGQETIARAAALSCNYLAGLNQWRVEGTGEDVFINAWAVQNGLQCADIAAAGAPASPENLEGKYGLLSIFRAEKNAHLLTDRLGTDWQLPDTKHKFVGACRSLQTPCAIADDILQENAIKPEQICGITIHASAELQPYPWYFKMEGVDNLVQAILSVPFGIAATFMAGDSSRISWLPPYDPMIVRLMSLCKVTFDERLAHDAFSVEIALKNGSRILKRRSEFPSLPEEEICRRFHEAVEQVSGKTAADEAVSAIMRLEELEEIRALCGLLRGNRQSAF